MSALNPILHFDEQTAPIIQENFDTIDKQIFEHFIIKDTAGNNRVLIGKRTDGTYGIDVSQAGFDVITATSDQLIMSSNFNTFKITLTGTATISGFTHATGTETFTVAHNLGFAPSYIVYWNDPFSVAGTNQMLPIYVISGGIQQNAVASVDSTNLYIKIRDDANFLDTYNGSKFKYYLFREVSTA